MNKKNEMFFIVDAGRRTELFLVVDEVDGVVCVLKTEMDKKKQSSNRISDIFSTKSLNLT